MIHVHIYEVIGKAEIDVESDDHHDAMDYALSMVKDGSVVCEASDTMEPEHIAIAFKGKIVIPDFSLVTGLQRYSPKVEIGYGDTYPDAYMEENLKGEYVALKDVTKLLRIQGDEK